MKTIAISIDEPTLEAVDRIASALSTRARGRGRSRGRGPNRSEVIRRALRDFVQRREKRQREERERRILAAHRARLARQAEALVAEQAQP